MSRFTLAWRKMMPSGTIFKKELFNPLFFFVLHSRARKWIRKEGKKEFSFQIFYRRMDRGYLSCETAREETETIAKTQTKKKNEWKNLNWKVHFCRIMCVRDCVLGGTSSPVLKNVRVRYRTRCATRCASPVVYFWKRIFKFEPKMLFWPSLFLSLSWDSKLILEHCRRDRVWRGNSLSVCVRMCVWNGQRSLYTGISIFLSCRVISFSHLRNK